MKQKSIALLLCGILVASLVGCSNPPSEQSDSENTSSGNSGKLSVLVASTTNTEALQNVYKGFEEETGIKTDVRLFPEQQISLCRLCSQNWQQRIIPML